MIHQWELDELRLISAFGLDATLALQRLLNRGEAVPLPPGTYLCQKPLKTGGMLLTEEQSRFLKPYTTLDPCYVEVPGEVSG